MLGSDYDYAELLPGDASHRKYYQLCWHRNDNYIGPELFCYLDPKIGSHEKFVEISKALKDIGPDIIHVNLEKGIIIQYHFECEGASEYYYLFDAYDEESYEEYPLSRYNLKVKTRHNIFGEAVRLLDSMIRIDIPNLRRLKEDDLRSQMKTFQSLYLNGFLDMSIFEIASQNENLEKLINETIANLNSQPWGNCHTDFEGRNIFGLPYWGGEHLYIIDYQDMCIGPAGIDLAGIVFDHYLCDELHSDKEALIKELKKLTSFADKFDTNEIYKFARWGCIQRNMRILGTLSNLYLEQDRSFRLGDLEGILTNLIRAIPDEHEDMKAFLKDQVLPLNNRRCQEILK